MSRAVEAHAAGVGPELAVEHVEAGGLAGAVRPDQRQQLAGRDREGHAVHGLHAAEGLSRGPATARTACSWRRARAVRVVAPRRSAARTADEPCGKASTSSDDDRAEHRRASTGVARISSVLEPG